MQKIKVKVRFVYPRYPDGSREVLAVFMGGRFGLDYKNGPRYECYAHIGQHGSCHHSYSQRKRATPEQYAPLLKELQSIGYDVQIV